MDQILDVLFRFYGLDWATMILGLTGTYLLSNQNKLGFAFNACACICGLSVAALSQQSGFIVYNMLLIVLMTKGYLSWGRSKSDAVKIATHVATDP